MIKRLHLFHPGIWHLTHEAGTFVLSQLVGGGAEQLGTVSMDGEALGARVVERHMRAFFETRAVAGDGHRAGRVAGRCGTALGILDVVVAGPTTAVLLERVQHQASGMGRLELLVGINNTA